MPERESDNLPFSLSQATVDTAFHWVARVRFSESDGATAYTGTHAFPIDRQASFAQSTHPMKGRTTYPISVFFIGASIPH
jgi:hypothetical protein